MPGPCLPPCRRPAAGCCYLQDPRCNALGRPATAAIGYSRGMRWFLVALVFVLSCSKSSSSGSGAPSKFTLVDDQSNKVNVEMVVPGSWQPDSSLPASIKMQYENPTAPTRQDYPDGRVWIAQPDGDRIHARMFVPGPKGVVMGFAMLTDKSKLDGVKAAFDTLKIVQ